MNDAVDHPASSTRGTPRGLFGNSGWKRAHCPSLN
jgi:hypothetical protein